MIHSLSGGIIADDSVLTYVFVLTDGGEKVWYISPFPFIKEGDRVQAPLRGRSVRGGVLRVEQVTKQTAPWPVNRTREIEAVL